MCVPFIFPNCAWWYLLELFSYYFNGIRKFSIRSFNGFLFVFVCVCVLLIIFVISANDSLRLLSYLQPLFHRLISALRTQTNKHTFVCFKISIESNLTNMKISFVCTVKPTTCVCAPVSIMYMCFSWYDRMHCSACSSPIYSSILRLLFATAVPQCGMLFYLLIRCSCHTLPLSLSVLSALLF